MTLTLLLAEAAERLIASGIPADEARVEARLLVQYVFGLTREQLFLHPQRELEVALLEPLLARRANREPLAYLIGERGFYGRMFRVTLAVLIPRPETEHLVEAVLAHPKRGRLLDIGTGSGCIAVTLAAQLPEAEVWATDLSEDALGVARENAERHGVVVRLCHGDLLAPLPLGLRFTAIVSNPPYIARTEEATLEPEVRQYEPALALYDPVGDGLTLYRRLAAEAPSRLEPEGLLAVEVGQGQADAVAAFWERAGLKNVTVTDDLAGIGRVVSGVRAD